MLCWKSSNLCPALPSQGPPGAAGAEGRQGEKGAKVTESIHPPCGRVASAGHFPFFRCVQLKKAPLNILCQTKDSFFFFFSSHEEKTLILPRFFFPLKNTALVILLTNHFQDTLFGAKAELTAEAN